MKHRAYYVGHIRQPNICEDGGNKSEEIFEGYNGWEFAKKKDNQPHRPSQDKYEERTPTDIVVKLLKAKDKRKSWRPWRKEEILRNWVHRLKYGRLRVRNYESHKTMEWHLWRTEINSLTLDFYIQDKYLLERKARLRLCQMRSTMRILC